jgi:hypothetical protein
MPVAQPIPVRVMQNDTIVVGKVTGVEEKNVKAPRFKNDAEKGEYRVFTVKIEQALKGGNGLTHIKVGCLIPAAPQPIGPKVQPVDPAVPIRPAIRPGIRPLPFQQPPMLEKGQEAILFLKSHVSEPFYTLGQQSDVIIKTAPTYKTDVEAAVKACKLANDPMAGLKSKDAQDRITTAGMLLMQYRTATGPGPFKEEEIPAEESKLIIEALASGNFDAPRTGRFDPMNPQQLFYQLNPQQYGYKAPADFRQQGPAMKKWLEDNAGKVRIKRFVTAEKK